MAVTAASFRLDFPEFQDVVRYPNSGINFWLNMARQLLNANRWGPPAPYFAASEAVAARGSGYAPQDVVNLAGGAFSTPAGLQVLTVDGSGGITTAQILTPGVYTSVPPNNPVPQLNTSGRGTGSAFNMVWKALPPTQYDLGTELFVAHNVSLERRAQDEAAAGGVPGITTGPVASKSVGGVSVSYDVGAGIVPGDSHWNLTIFGTRFMFMVNLVGMGPVSIVGGGPWGQNNGPGWPGPIVDRGWGPNG